MQYILETAKRLGGILKTQQVRLGRKNSLEDRQVTYAPKSDNYTTLRSRQPSPGRNCYKYNT